ncbi:MAG: ABC transporter substrate-binding protein [Deltaproteobacteria bacterium]|nr:ABC transporter substrate-binding protein [Deltaproteobacteria bacterium]
MKITHIGFLFFVAFFLASCGSENTGTVSQAPAPAVKSGIDKSGTPTKLAEGEVWENGQKYFVLNVPYSPEPTSPDLLVTGEENGFFEEYGIKLKSVGAVPGNQVIPSVLKGLIHTNSGGHINTTIAAISAGAKIKAVSQKTETSQRIPHKVAIVRTNSPIRTAHDLVGKKIGTSSVSGCSGYFSLAYMRKFGIPDVKNASNLVVIKEVVLEQALRQGDVDVSLMHKVPEYYAKSKEFEVIFTDYDIWENRGGGTPNFFHLDFIAQHPDVVRNFVAAMAKTVNWANDHPLENRQITARRFNIDVNTVTERYYAPNAIIKDDSVTVWVDVLKEFNEIPEAVPSEKIYTNEFNPYYTS